MTVHQLARTWKVIKNMTTDGLTPDSLESAMGSKNMGTDLFVSGMVVTMTFPDAEETRGSVSFLTCTVEIIHISHTHKGEPSISCSYILLTRKYQFNSTTTTIYTNNV